MLKHKTSVWYPEDHDEKLAKTLAFETYQRELDARGYNMAKRPVKRIIRDKSRPMVMSNLAPRGKGFRVIVEGEIRPKTRPE